MIQLTDHERHSLEAVRHGADVYSYAIACDLRAIQSKYPHLVKIGPRRAYDGDGTDQVPYFGAIATTEGRRVLRQLRAAEELPPCLGEAIRDTTYDIHRTGCGVEA